MDIKAGFVDSRRQLASRAKPIFTCLCARAGDRRRQKPNDAWSRRRTLRSQTRPQEARDAGCRPTPAAKVCEELRRRSSVDKNGKPKKDEAREEFALARLHGAVSATRPDAYWATGADDRYWCRTKLQVASAGSNGVAPGTGRMAPTTNRAATGTGAQRCSTPIRWRPKAAPDEEEQVQRSRSPRYIELREGERRRSLKAREDIQDCVTASADDFRTEGGRKADTGRSAGFERRHRVEEA